MTYGITAWHIRVLCDNGWSGGNGYTPQEAGDLTVDQILMLLTDRKILEDVRKTSVGGAEAAEKLAVGADGLVAGIDRDGKPMRAAIKGISRARQLMIEAVERKAAEKAKRLLEKPKRRARRKR